MTLSDLLEKAGHYAEATGAPLNTGHLLLAIFTGTGTAANTLSLRGLTETQIRGAIRSEGAEPENTLKLIAEQSGRYATTVGLGEPSAIHVLAAIANVRMSLGYQILSGAGLNCDTIRNQSLRNMCTGMTPEHGALQSGQSVVKKNSLHTAQSRAINVADTTASRSSASETPAPETAANARIPVPRVLRDDVGTTLEQAQRKSRSASRSSAGTVSPAEEPARANTAMSTPGTSAAVPRPASLRPDQFPQLCALGRNLVEAAVHGELDPIVGRHAEMEQMIDVINKRRGSCPLLVGPPGVGKTAVVLGFASRLANGELSGAALDAIIEVRMSDLIGGTSLRGAQSEKIEEIRKELEKARGRIALFFDDIHILLSSNDAAEAVVELKEAVCRGEIPMIAATEQSEYNRLMAPDPAFSRMFTAIEIAEPSELEAREIVQNVLPGYAAHHHVDIEPEAAEAAVRLSSRYMPEETLPDKAIGIIDLAGARVRRRGEPAVRREDVAEVIAGRIGVPVERLSSTDAERLLQLESILSQSVVGHGHVLSAIGETLRRNGAGFRSGRPIGSFLFLGPTGVGKTETAKALARLLFADERAMIRLDMSEFSEPHAVARMVGAPPGYVGHEEGGQLTEAVRRRSYCLVLLDEIEKAHRDVVQVLLQVLDDGRLTDGRGRTVNFQNTVVVMTSNLGADLREIVPSRRRVGFGPASDQDQGSDDISALIESRAREALPPELWNRIDEPLVFAPLSRHEVSQIARLLLNGLSKRLESERGIALEADSDVVDFLIDAGGFDLQLGARPMRRTIQRLIEGPVARIILEANPPVKGAIHARLRDNQIVFDSSAVQ